MMRLHSAVLTLHFSSAGSTLTTDHLWLPPNWSGWYTNGFLDTPISPGKTFSQRWRLAGGRCQADLPVFRWKSVRSNSRTRDGRGEVLNMAPLCSKRWVNSCWSSSAHPLSPPRSTFCWPETDGKAWAGKLFLLSFSHKGTALVVSCLMALIDTLSWRLVSTHLSCLQFCLSNIPCEFHSVCFSNLCGLFSVQFRTKQSLNFLVEPWWLKRKL